MILTVIPARGSSKGIPRKNLQTVGGVSLLGHALNVARDLNYPIIVSTDDPDVAAEARQYTDCVVFAHPPVCHGDNSRAVDVWRHAWLAAERMHMNQYEYGVYLEPSSPQRTAAHVEACIELLLQSEVDAVWTVEPVPLRHHADKQLRIRDTSSLAFATAEGEFVTRRQDLKPAYIRNGLCYAATRAQIIDDHRMWGVVLPVITESVVNIDTPADLAALRE